MDNGVVAATTNHAIRVARGLRDIDKFEVSCMVPWSFEVACVEAVRASPYSRAWVVDGEPVCIFGVNPLSEVTGHGAPWLLGTDLIDKHRMRFLRNHRPYLEEMRRMHTLLWNHVSAENYRAIAWLRWMGFEVADHPMPHGRFEKPFYRFEIAGTAQCVIQ